MATLHAKNREKLPRGIMGRLHNPRSVEHMSPGKAGRAVQFKPLLTPLSLIMYVYRNELPFFSAWVSVPRGGGGGRALAEKLGRGVRPASQNPYPIYDQNLRFSLPYL